MFFLQNRQAGAFDELSVDASYLVCLLWAISLSPRINHVHVCLFVCSFVCLFVEKICASFSFELRTIFINFQFSSLSCIPRVKKKNSYKCNSVIHFTAVLPCKVWVVVSDIFNFPSYLGKIPILTNIFSKGLKPPSRSPLKAHRFFWVWYIQNMSCTSPAPSKAWFENHHFLGSWILAHPHETCGKTQGFQEAVEPISIQRRALRGCMEFLGSGWIFTPDEEWDWNIYL